jgi:GTP cyclohydrolase II
MAPSKPLKKPRSPAPKASPVARVARAVAALRRGEPVVIAGTRPLTMFAVETADGAVALKGSPILVLTQARARTLKIRLYTPEVAGLRLPKGIDLTQLRAIADPTLDLRFPMKGPFETVRDGLPDGAAEAVRLAKLAGLLPAVLVRSGAAKGAFALAKQDVADFDAEAVRTLTIVARARVPLEGAEKTEMVAFRAADAGPEHYAIVIGAPDPRKAVLTRLHSECFTGDLLGSLKCDCGTQLRGAIAAISKAGAGVLLYMAQEGRGIGLINKLRAYRLQDQGFDTVEANERLGFASDERRYAIAARMLDLLGYRKIKLLTNNPDKVAALKKEGIDVVARMRHAFPGNAHNRDYLRVKKEKGGHLL